jgi:predicted nucleic acid-binding protein
MILVDTSIWIEMLSRKQKFSMRDEDLPHFATCGPVIQEVFQGLRAEPAAAVFREAFLALPVLSDPIPLALFLAAADIYQQSRRRRVERLYPNRLHAMLPYCRVESYKGGVVATLRAGGAYHDFAVAPINHPARCQRSRLAL